MSVNIAIIDISNPKRAENTRDSFQRLGSKVYVLGWDDGLVTGDLPKTKIIFDLALIHITDCDKAEKITSKMTNPGGSGHQIQRKVWYSGTHGRMAGYPDKVFRKVGTEGLIDGEVRQLLDFLKADPSDSPPPLFLRPPENSAMVGFLILAKLGLVAEFPWNDLAAMQAKDKEELLQKMEWREDAMPARVFTSFVSLKKMKDKVRSAEYWKPLERITDGVKGEFEYFQPNGYDKSAFKVVLEKINTGKISETTNQATWIGFLEKVWKAFIEVNALLGK